MLLEGGWPLTCGWGVKMASFVGREHRGGVESMGALVVKFLGGLLKPGRLSSVGARPIGVRSPCAGCLIFKIGQGSNPLR